MVADANERFPVVTPDQAQQRIADGIIAWREVGLPPHARPAVYGAENDIPGDGAACLRDLTPKGPGVRSRTHRMRGPAV